MENILAIVSSILLISIIVALIFKKDFRKDILVAEGEASIFGILNVKGVAIIVLAGLFLGTLIWSTSKDFPKDLANTVYENQKSHFNQIDYKCKNISQEVFNYYVDYSKGYSVGYSRSLPENTSREIAIQKTSHTVLTKYFSSSKILDNLKNKSYRDLIEHYRKINLALQEGDLELYNELIKKTPTAIIELNDLGHVIQKITQQQDKQLNDYLKEIKNFLSE